MLRLLLLLAVVIGLLLWWKHSQRGRRETPPPAAGPNPPEAMLRCAECGLHLPSSQALPGRGGVFCSAEHRQRHEDRG